MACRGQVLAIALLLSVATLLSLAPLPGVEARKLIRNKISTFNVYNVLIIQGANSTKGYNAVQCGGTPVRRAPVQFGDVFCFDMPLLEKQDVESKLLGRVQGTFAVSQLDGARVFVAETFIVNATSLPYKGSFSALGIENVGLPSSKPITGGTGDYQLVTGDAFTTPLGAPTTDKFGNLVFWFLYEFVFAS
ncbi:hypothetical protein L7F22_052468 [Adiantum nelumboides]|nr:hypothetical protein [Adiantum nelumboides]MCO5598373.1 hypothetical protein [Adiantum nelumboides]